MTRVLVNAALAITVLEDASRTSMARHPLNTSLPGHLFMVVGIGVRQWFHDNYIGDLYTSILSSRWMQSGVSRGECINLHNVGQYPRNVEENQIQFTLIVIQDK